MKKIKLNGDFIVCKKLDTEQLQQKSGIFVYNGKTVPIYEIIELHYDPKKVDFPFAVGDKVCSASTGTIVNLDGEKTWLFKPEHIMGKLFFK